MNTEAPLVSVIVRTKDRPILLRKALQSIAAQTCRQIEVILVNDGGCSLDTVSLASALGDIPLRYERLEKNTGRAHAGNTGIKLASGKYIGFLDDDDEFYEDHISVLAGILENYDFKVAYSDANISFHSFDPEGKDMSAVTSRLFSSKDFSFQDLLIDNYIPLICLLFRREVLEEFRGFDESFDIYEDWDLLIRIAGRYPFFHAAKTTAEYIQWSSTLQVSQTPEFADLAEAAHLRIIKKHREEFSEEIIRGLVHYKRALREKDQNINELESRIKEQGEHAAGLEKSSRESQGLISGLNKAVQEKDADIARLEKIIAEKEGYAAGFENFVRKQEEHLAGLQKTLEEVHKHIIRLDNTIQERDTQITRLGDVIRKSEALIESLENAVEDQKGRLVQLGMDVKARDERISGLEKDIGEKGSHIAGLEKALQEKDLRIAGIENEMAEKDARLANITNEVANRDLRIDNLEGLVQEKDGYVERLESMNANLEQQIKEKDSALNTIYGSRGWKGLLFYYKVRDALLPPRIFRRELLKSPAERIGGPADHNRYPQTGDIQTDVQDIPVPPVKEKNESIQPLAKEEIIFHPYGGNEMKDAPAAETVPGRERYMVTPLEKPECGKEEIGDAPKGIVLIAGVYLADQKNAIGHIVHELNQSACYKVEQKWIALSGDAPSPEVHAVTVTKAGEPQPKFVLLNKLLSTEDLAQYDYILICDDDIFLPANFLDNFLDLQHKYDFALAQPARTHNSYTDHPIVEQFKGLKARRTRFVEIGPVLSIRRDAYSLLLPFDETAHMGWGYDFVWPYIIGEAGLRMGIIDATPLDHSMRKPVQNYNYDEANSAMQKYLSRTPHLSRKEAFTILESYT